MMITGDRSIHSVENGGQLPQDKVGYSVVRGGVVLWLNYGGAVHSQMTIDWRHGGADFMKRLVDGIARCKKKIADRNARLASDKLQADLIRGMLAQIDCTDCVEVK